MLTIFMYVCIIYNRMENIVKNIKNQNAKITTFARSYRKIEESLPAPVAAFAETSRDNFFYFVPAKSSSQFCINLKKQSQFVKVPDWRKFFDNKILCGL
jgi:hypothetical protein